MVRVNFREVDSDEYKNWLYMFLSATPVPVGSRSTIYKDCRGKHIAYSIPGTMNQSNYGPDLYFILNNLFRIAVEENEVLVVAFINDDNCLGFIKLDKQTGDLIEQRWYQ